MLIYLFIVLLLVNLTVIHTFCGHLYQHGPSSMPSPTTDRKKIPFYYFVGRYATSDVTR